MFTEENMKSILVEPEQLAQEIASDWEPRELGYANAWFLLGGIDDTPAIVLKCRKLDHKLDRKTVGRCITQVICRECGYSYHVDSSD